MRKIRIGNDIRLKLKIEPNTMAGFDKIDEFDQSNVKQLKCYLINTSYNKPKIDGMCPKPFKRVGFPEFYHPTAHSINNSGFSSYHMSPANLCNYDRFVPDFHGFHWWPGYRGFGLHPEHFHDHCPHLQHGPKPNPFFCPNGCCNCEDIWDDCCFKKPDIPCNEPYHPANEPYDIYGRPAEDHRHPSPCDPIYLADSQVLPTKNTLTCMFPAVQQGLCGTYKLVIVLTVFEQGWGRHNLRTYTIDKGSVFELVDDNSGESGNIYIDVDSSGSRERLIDSVYTEHDSYTLATNSQVPLGGFDLFDHIYNIYLKLMDGTIAIYNGQNPNISQLMFSSSNEDILTVGKDGTLHAKDIENITETVQVTVRDIDNNFSYTFDVTVKKIDTVKIGFNSIDNINALDVNDQCFNEYDVKALGYKIANPQDGFYLWVVSQRRIHYIKAIDERGDIVAELSSGIRVPMLNGEVKDCYFCYRSVSPILAGTMNIKIIYA